MKEIEELRDRLSKYEDPFEQVRYAVDERGCSVLADKVHFSLVAPHPQIPLVMIEVGKIRIQQIDEIKVTARKCLGQVLSDIRSQSGCITGQIISQCRVISLDQFYSDEPLTRPEPVPALYKEFRRLYNACISMSEEYSLALRLHVLLGQPDVVPPGTILKKLKAYWPKMQTVLRRIERAEAERNQS